MIDARTTVKEDPMPCRQELKCFRVIALERLDECRTIGQRRFTTIRLIDQAMQVAPVY